MERAGSVNGPFCATSGMSESLVEEGARREQAVPEVPRKKPVSVVLDGVPLGTFINVLFGMELGFGLQLDQAVLGRPDLVSLRLTEAQAPERVYSIGVEVLKNYGVSVRDLGGILYFAPANAQQGGAAPALIATRSLPEAQRRAVNDDLREPRRQAALALVRRADRPSLTDRERGALGVAGALFASLNEMREAALLFEKAGDDVRAADAWCASCSPRRWS